MLYALLFSTLFHKLVLVINYWIFQILNIAYSLEDILLGYWGI